jgi:quinohemoprotein ethanol dehydrogenase
MKAALERLKSMLSVVCCFTISSAVMASPPVESRLLDSSDGNDWPAYGRTYGEGHFSPLSEINTENVSRLGLKWALELPVGNSVTTPLALDGVLYFATGYSVVQAVDARSGKQLWSYDPQVAIQAGHKLQAPWGTRGLAWWRDKVFTATADGRLIAIDVVTGKPLWTAMTVDKSDGRYITGAPRVFDGNVIIGHGGADFGAIRGYVTAYDAETGKKLWRFYTVPGNPSLRPEGEASDSVMPMAAETWAGEWWKHGGGGTVWNAMTYDREFGTILIGTGNGAPWNYRIRSEGKGDNLFLCSMIALDARTGAYKWHYQFNPGETWDYNAAMDMQLAELRIGGKDRKVVVTAPKNGFFYVIDRSNGKLISAEPFVVVNWASKIDLKTGRPVEIPAARYPNGSTFVLRPSPSGAHNWMPMAYNPRSGLVYIPTLNLATAFTDKGINPQTWQRQPGVILNGGVSFAYVFDDSIPGVNTSTLLAWDPVAQRKRWEVPTPDFWNGGVMTSAGNLVFQGQVNSKFSAYAADTGKLVWSFDAQAPVVAPPISYSVDGRQYITVLSGFGTTPAAFGPLIEKYGIDYRTQKRRVLTFMLDGKESLPPPAPRTKPVLPPDESFIENLEAYKRGMVTFGTRCALCHGFDMVAGGNAPDLRYSTIPFDSQAFATLVRDGALVPLGMPRFDDLSDADREDVRQYIRTRRRE